MYIALEQICEYGKYAWLTKEGVRECLDECDVEINGFKKRIGECQESIEFLKNLCKPVDEIMDSRETYLQDIEDYKEEIEGWESAKNRFSVYYEILDEAHDTKYEPAWPQYDEDHYILIGHECEPPEDRLVPDLTKTTTIDYSSCKVVSGGNTTTSDKIEDIDKWDKAYNEAYNENFGDDLRKEISKFINETAGEKILDE